MQTHDLGKLFWSTVRLTDNAPILHRAPMQETDEPFRNSWPLVIRVWRGRGLIIGWWEDTGLEEDEALRKAIQAREEEWDDVAQRFR